MPATSPARPLLAACVLALGVAGFAAAWMIVSMRLQQPLAWLSVLGAADVVLLLHVTRVAPSWRRAAVAMLATGGLIALANFLIVAGNLGQDMGMRPLQSALLLGPRHAWTYVQLMTGPLQWAWYALALLIAGWGGLSARRPAPSAR